MPNTDPSANDPQSGAGLTKSQRRALRAQQQQAELAARKRKETVRRVVLTSVAALALVVLIVVLVFVGTKQNNNSADTSDGNVPTGVPKIGQSKYGLTVGKPSAPHQIIFYEDFLCPHCGIVESVSHTALAKAAAAGKVYIDYRPFNLISDPYSAQADNAFFAVKDIAGDTVAKSFHDLLFANQPEEPGPSDDTAGLIKLANQVVPSSEQSKVDAAITNNSYASTVTAATQEAEGTAGVQGTPTIYLDGHTVPYTSDEGLGNTLVQAVQ